MSKLKWYKPSEKLPEDNKRCLINCDRFSHEIIESYFTRKYYPLEEGEEPYYFYHSWQGEIYVKEVNYWCYLQDLIKTLPNKWIV